MCNMILVRTKNTYYSPGQPASQAAKIVWLTTFFLNSKCFFVRLLSWPLAGRLLHPCSVLLYHMLF